MDWLGDVNRKLFMALASKGKSQHVCDCDQHELWNGGWSPTDAFTDKVAIFDDNPAEIDSFAGSRDLESVFSSTDEEVFDTIKIKYTGTTSTPKTFVNNLICIKDLDDNSWDLSVKEVRGGGYDSVYRSNIEGELTGTHDGLFSMGNAELGMTEKLIRFYL